MTSIEQLKLFLHSGNLLRNYGSVLMQEAKEYVRERMKGELHLYNEMYGMYTLICLWPECVNYSIISTCGLRIDIYDN